MANSRVLKTCKHVGRDPDSEREDETIGFIVMDSLHNFASDGLEFEAYSGPRRVRGYVSSIEPSNSTSSGFLTDFFLTLWVQPIPRRWPYFFRRRFRKVPQVIVLSQAAMSSREGSWAILAGTAPERRKFGIAVDGDELLDHYRWHNVIEPIDYVAFDRVGSIALR